MCLRHFSGRCGSIRQTSNLNNRAANNVEVGAISIGPESDHSLPLSLTISAKLLRLDWLLKMQSKTLLIRVFYITPFFELSLVLLTTHMPMGCTRSQKKFQRYRQ